MATDNSSDCAIAVIAARQHGNVTRRQLAQIGLTDGEIAYRIRIGRLIRRYTGVYAVGHVPPSPISLAAAAVLACGPDAALSRGSAAALWRIVREWRYPIEIVGPRQQRRRGIRIHRCTTLAREDITVHFGIRVTSPARTLLAVAPQLSPAQLADAYNELRARGFLHPDTFRAMLDRCAGHPAIPRLRPLLGPCGGPTRSRLERAFLRFLEDRGLPLPLTNVRVGGREVDAYFPHHGLIVELDSPAFHGDPMSFERDRDYDAAALAAGRRTLRITNERLTHQPDLEEARLRAVLGL